MRTSLAFLALAATAFAVPQVTDNIAPKGNPPKGCTKSYSGQFEVTIFKPGKSKRDVEERSCNGEGVLVLSLKDGVLKDAKDRTGYISESFQFQFDKPAQAGAIYTSGFSVCSNGTLAFGSSAIFWQCQSGDFYNLYDRNWAEQCEPVEFGVMPCGKSSKSVPKKRIVGSSVIATTVVTVVSDGTTKEVPTTIAVPMCQIGDGQVQVRTTPCDDMQLPIITAPPVSQSKDGKLQVPTTAPPAPPAVQPQGKPAESAEPGNPAEDKPGNGEGASGNKGCADGDNSGSCGSGDEGKPAGKSNPGATPAGNDAPDNTGAAQGDKPGSVEPSGTGAQGAGKAKPSETGEEVLATDSGTPSDTEADETGKAQSTRVVKPFKPESTGSDDAEETGSDSSSGSKESGSSSDAAQSDALRIAASLGMLFMSGLFGSMLML
ncbi:hypothetical protein F53441_9298 [Fusarium austroafricanum]|uniref:Cell wall mannoprotein PIR1-like C-terminal domain-containing protein n=1 Tax=Fusarium austroafricanum TaxID=2364996 RepID=A0A8H4NVN9_9HYPO|nr:hypothetical protein F53441_9298 [Fusarium austroafricanum]